MNSQPIENKFFALLLTNDVLDRLVASHNKVFGLSFWSMFSPIPFKEIENDLGLCLDFLEQIRDLYPNLPAGPLSLDWPQVDMAYFAYFDAVFEAYDNLRHICSQLARKAKGNRYRISDYNDDVNKYNSLVERYRFIGQDLNRLVRG